MASRALQIDCLAIRPAGDDAHWNGVMLGLHNPLEVINPRFETGDRNGVNLGVERKPIERVGDNRTCREFPGTALAWGFPSFVDHSRQRKPKH